MTVQLPTKDPGGSVVPVLPATPVLPAAALDRLPAGPVGADPVWRLVAAFLVGYPPATARAYLGDLRAWIGWCAEQGVHPFTARRHHVDHWARQLAAVRQPRQRDRHRGVAAGEPQILEPQRCTDPVLPQRGRPAHQRLGSEPWWYRIRR